MSTVCGALAAAGARPRRRAHRARAPRTRGRWRARFPPGRERIWIDQVAGQAALREAGVVAVERVAVTDAPRSFAAASTAPARAGAAGNRGPLGAGDTHRLVSSLSPVAAGRDRRARRHGGSAALRPSRVSLRRLLWLRAGRRRGVASRLDAFLRMEAWAAAHRRDFPIPKIALCRPDPLAGIGEPSKVRSSRWRLFPMVINTYAGVRHADPLLVRAAVAFGAGRGA